MTNSLTIENLVIYKAAKKSDRPPVYVEPVPPKPKKFEVNRIRFACWLPDDCTEVDWT